MLNLRSWDLQLFIYPYDDVVFNLTFDDISCHINWDVIMIIPVMWKYRCKLIS